MLSAAVIATTLAVASALPKIEDADHHTLAIRDEIINEVNSAQTTWTASRHGKFANATVADVKRYLGTILPGEEGYYEPPAKHSSLFATADSDIPESFNVVENWPECAAITGMVRDQSDCGSCWAFGSTEAFNDRHCIATGDAKTVLSPEDTVSCCSGAKCAFSMGCNGGQPSGAWKWFTTTGVSSGGNWADNGKGTTCKPYSMQSCAHHVEPTGDLVACDSLDEYATPKCTSTCSEADYPTPYSADKLKAKTEYSVKSVTDMQKELMEKGTLSVAFTVYEDFEAYTGGVYQHVSGKSLGGHAIKMVGWGVDNGTPYWTCTNSWNDSWGEKGQFRILRGKNECGIEGSVVAGDV
jgi:cathepsin B